jgi:hypothetical protein
MVTIDKKTFLAGFECPTRGWFVHHAAREAPTPGLAWRFYAGSEVARKARDWLGGGQTLKRTPIQEALDSTNAAIKSPGTTLLFEASFRSDGCIARADALRRLGDGWHLLEIKAGISPKDGDAVKDEYISDVAYTAWVAISAGVKLNRITLVLLSRKYRLNGKAPMFVEVNVTEMARVRVAEFAKRAASIVAAATQSARPHAVLQFVCRDCDYFKTDCLGVSVDDPLFILPRLSEKKFDELRAYERLTNLPGKVKLTHPQKRVLDVIRSGKAHTDLDGLRLLDDIISPIYYLDFEAVSPYLPWFPDRPPYDATPFQYSLHVQAELHCPTEHRYYLAPVSGDWRRELITRLLEDVGTRGSIVVYSAYEKARLRALASVFPDLAAQIEATVSRLFDLEKVVKKGYAHPGFEGRTSIKMVLPIVAPDLSYAGLQIGNGDDAAASFSFMRVGITPATSHATERAALLAYCEQDTLALVRLHDYLLEKRMKVG